MPDIRYERHGAVRLITIDRPAKMNSLDFAANDALVEAWREFDRDAEACVAVITGAGDKAFCAGADLKTYTMAFAGTRAPEFRERFTDGPGFGGITRNLDIDKPIVAAINGYAISGGFELALACDVIVADATARFAFPELRLGLIPGFGGLPRLDRDCSNALVRDLLFTGRSIQAKRAHQAGFVSQVVGAGHAVTAARAVTQQVLKFDPHVVARAKRFAKPIPAERLRAEKELFLELFDRPAVQEALARFVARDDAQPYLP